jgi:hypothetical protein
MQIKMIPTLTEVKRKLLKKTFTPIKILFKDFLPSGMFWIKVNPKVIRAEAKTKTYNTTNS